MRLKHIYILIAMLIGIGTEVSAQMSSHMLQSRPFSEIYVKGNINVECRESADSAGLIVFSSTPGVFSAVNCNNVGRRLNVIVDGVSSTVLRRELSTIVVYYSGALSAVSYAGAGEMRVRKADYGKSVAVIMTGAGRLRIDGVSAQQVTCSVAGSGSVSMAGTTRANNVACSVSGSGVMEFSHIEAKNVSATVNGRGCLVVNGQADKGSFALKGSGSIDASSLSCSSLTAGAYGSGQIFYSRNVANVVASGNKDNVISR